MKILHVITGLRRAAGTTVFCVRVAEVCAQADHTVAIAVMGQNPETDAVPEGVPVVTWKPGEALPFRPEILHVHGLWTPWQHRAEAWARRERIPIVLSPHGMLAPWAMAHKRWKKLLPWTLYQHDDIRRAALIHTTAAQETQWVRELGFRNPVAEVPLGTDLPDSPAAHDGPAKSLLFVGRIYPVKGLDLLLKAWALAKGRLTDWHLLLVGPDQAGHTAELERLAGSLKLTTRRGSAEGVGLHVNTEHVHIEFVDDRNLPVEKGLYGKVLLTNLEDRVFPLIRYENGDRGCWLTHGCPCGRTLPLIDAIKGRESESFVLPSGMTVNGEYLTTLFDNAPDVVHGFRVVQRKDSSIRVEYIPARSDAEAKAILGRIQAGLETRLNHEVPVTFEAVDSIAHDRGKLRFVVRER